jgi:uncharacterized protein HemX
MAEPEQKKPGGAFYESKWFKGTGAVVALLAAIVALGAAVGHWSFVKDLFEGEAVELEKALQSANANVETRTPRNSEQLEETVEEVKEESSQAIEEGKKVKATDETISG